ncbi:MAG TPA: GTPase, partial [Alphaproteobacteria bacterium]|nr:GTPase [Alphaproteobacteria bacterium]
MAARERRRRIVIMGAAGRDFHNFNVVFRDDPMSEVVAFTAAQIPGIAGRRYPSALAGALYPDGIPIEDEDALDALCRERAVDEVVFAYSDVTHAH